MKKLCFIATFVVFTLTVSAQDGAADQPFKFGVGALLGIPVNNLDFTSIGAGIDLLGQYSVSEKISITADAGYTSMFGKKGAPDFSIIPLRAGLRFYATPQFYIAGKGGVGITKLKGYSSVTSTAYSFGAGYFINPNIDVSGTYDGYSKNGSLGLVAIRLGYTFGSN